MTGTIRDPSTVTGTTSTTVREDPNTVRLATIRDPSTVAGTTVRAPRTVCGTRQNRENGPSTVAGTTTVREDRASIPGVPVWLAPNLRFSWTVVADRQSRTVDLAVKKFRQVLATSAPKSAFHLGADVARIWRDYFDVRTLIPADGWVLYAAFPADSPRKNFPQLLQADDLYGVCRAILTLVLERQLFHHNGPRASTTTAANKTIRKALEFWTRRDCRAMTAPVHESTVAAGRAVATLFSEAKIFFEGFELDHSRGSRDSTGVSYNNPFANVIGYEVLKPKGRLDAWVQAARADAAMERSPQFVAEGLVFPDRLQGEVSGEDPEVVVLDPQTSMGAEAGVRWIRAECRWVVLAEEGLEPQKQAIGGGARTAPRRERRWRKNKHKRYRKTR